MDFVLNGQGHGSVAGLLMANNFDMGCLRPFIGADGRSYLTVNRGGKPQVIVHNADATLRKQEWIELDRAVTLAARNRLRAFADLRAANSFTIPNGMGTTVFQTQNMSDPGSASVSMDGLRQNETDRPVFDLTSLPLPIIHSDFSFSARQVATSRNTGTPLDVTMAEVCSRRVAEVVEQLTLGTYATYSYGGGTIYGYTNFPSRLTKTMTLPTAGGWTPHTLITELLDARQKSIDAKNYGPWKVYNSPAWDKYLDEDYSSAKGDNTVRERVAKINGFSAPQTLDNLSGYKFLLVQMTSEVARAVVGADVTTVQWESHGGMQLNFKVMCILVPQIRADYNGNTGIVDCTGA